MNPLDLHGPDFLAFYAFSFCIAVSLAIVLRFLLRTPEPDLLAETPQLHPYEVPEFLVIPVAEGHEAYLRWIADSTLT